MTSIADGSVNIQATSELVNSLKGGPILHAKVEICSEGWESTLHDLEKPLPLWYT